MKDVVVYTAITAGRDELLPALFHGEDVRYVCFSDRSIEAEGWEIVRLYRGPRGARRDSRVPKIRPDLFLPDSQISLWHDGHFQLKVDPRGFCEEWLQGVDLALFRHFRRDCLYDEAITCKNLKRDSALRIDSQVDRYRAEGMPSHWGLFSGTVLLRRHTKPEVVKFSNLWWDEYTKGSCRDQIGLPYAMRKTGIKFRIIPGHPRWTPDLFFRGGHRRGRGKGGMGP